MLIYREKRKANIFENCTSQQVNKAKSAAYKQRSLAADGIGRSDKKNFLIHGELTETNKALLFF